MRPRIAIPVPHFQKAEYSARSWPQYARSVELAGGEPVGIEIGMTNSEIAATAIDCDGVLLPGSPADIPPQKYGQSERHPETADSDPGRDNADELLIQDAYNVRKPILGICYGVQQINVWRTGTLLQHIESGVPHGAGKKVLRAHNIDIERSSLLQKILDTAFDKKNGFLFGPVNSSHHQSVDQVGDGLKVVARCPDDGVIEAIEGTGPDHFVLGVQWHPERSFDEEESSRAIFKAFVDAAVQWRKANRTEGN